MKEAEPHFMKEAEPLLTSTGPNIAGIRIFVFFMKEAEPHFMKEAEPHFMKEAEPHFMKEAEPHSKLLCIFL